jgi:phage terminase large subunit-like protein
MARKARKSTTSPGSRRRRAPVDPVAKYAKDVLAGKIVAGPHVRNSCKRHLEDLKDGFARGLVWDLPAAMHAIGYFRDVLRLNGGEWEGKPYDPFPWELFIIGSIFGWKLADNTRRFRVGYVETAKGSGKSPIAAGIGLFGLTADGEARAEVYAAATKKDQAQILFRDAVAMVDQSPALRSRIVKSGVGENVWNLAYRDAASWFRPISADDGQSGPRPHFSLLDEVHEHRTGYVVEMLKAGQKWRRQPLMFMITNSGTEKTSVCGEYHDYAIRVAAGDTMDDSFFSYVCALDKDEEPFKDEACWPKVNPSLPYGLPGMKYLRDQVAQARGMPAKESVVRRLNFCQWVEADSPAISREVWMRCADKAFDRELLIGRRCWGGLDLSSTTDLTALALLFEPDEDDAFWRLLVKFWIPGDGLHDKADKDRVPYLAWRDAGHLEALPGRAINKLAVARACAESAALYDLQNIAYDRWRIEDLKRISEDEGLNLPLVPFGQGYQSMSPAVDELERLMIDGKLRHFDNPVLNFCAANAVMEIDPAGNRKYSKKKATGRIDGLVATVMAAGIGAISSGQGSIDEWLNTPAVAATG